MVIQNADPYSRSIVVAHSAEPRMAGVITLCITSPIMFWQVCNKKFTRSVDQPPRYSALIFAKHTVDLERVPEG